MEYCSYILAGDPMYACLGLLDRVDNRLVNLSCSIVSSTQHPQTAFKRENVKSCFATIIMENVLSRFPLIVLC